MKMSEAFPSKYLKAADLKGKAYNVVIHSVGLELLDGTKDRKMVIGFERWPKTMIANRTNCNTIAKLYGDETEDWVGKMVVIFPAWVDFKGETVEAIRIRAPDRAAEKRAIKPTSPDPQQTPTEITPPHIDTIPDHIRDTMNDEISF